MTVSKIPIQVNHYTGLSTDTKPTGVPIGSTFLEYNTGITYISYDGTNWEALPLVGSYKHLDDSGTIKTTKGILLGVVINRPDTTASATITLYDSVDDSGDVIAIINVDVAIYVIPTTLTYNVTFLTGLYAKFSNAVTADITVSYR